MSYVRGVHLAPLSTPWSARGNCFHARLEQSLYSSAPLQQIPARAFNVYWTKLPVLLCFISALLLSLRLLLVLARPQLMLRPLLLCTRLVLCCSRLVLCSELVSSFAQLSSLRYSASRSSRSTPTFGVVAVESAASPLTLLNSARLYLRAGHSDYAPVPTCCSRPWFPRRRPPRSGVPRPLQHKNQLICCSIVDCTTVIEPSRPPIEGKDFVSFVHARRCREALQSVRL